MVQWENKLRVLAGGSKEIIPKIEKYLDNMGQDGWELVSSIRLDLLPGSDQIKYVVFLKRPIEID